MTEMTTVVIQPTAPPAPTLVDVPTNTTSPPIVYFFRLVFGVVSTTYSTVPLFFSSSWSLLKTVFSPIRSLVSALSSPLLYILAPVIVLGRILLDALVLAPFSLITGVAREVYPIYVFVGAAFIWAIFVGLCARGVTHYMQLSIFGSENLVSARDMASRVKVEAPRAKTPKRVSIKEETEVRTVLR